MLGTLENTYTIVGIDPGNNLGISILYIDCYSNAIRHINSMTYVLDSYVKEETYNVLLERLMKLKEIISTIISEVQPVMVCLEASFMNSRFPKSVIQLSQYVGTIEVTTRDIYPWSKILKLPPKYIKARCGAGGTADKDDMRKTLSTIPCIANNINLNYLSEHSIDSLAMAYVAYLEILNNPYLLWSLPF